MKVNVKLIYGVGVNDSDGQVYFTARDGSIVRCEIYARWKDMLKRCYSKKYQLDRPTYSQCSVSDEWLKFSNFKTWMEAQDWKGLELDKDLLIAGNKVYSKESCAFVSQSVNSFLNDMARHRGLHPIGVHFDKGSKRFRARCRNPFTGKPDYLGCFTDAEVAHEAWKRRKHELACQLAEIQNDDRVANALRTRYCMDLK